MEIKTNSLWIFDKRDTSGAHLAWYWGNFIPQIPRQLMLRFTKKGDWVLDPFLGSGTTLIECRRLGRNGIGIELNSQVAEKAKLLIEKENNRFNVITEVIVGDSMKIDIEKILKNWKINKVQLIIMHPPYHDIIKFSNDSRDLSNAESLERFLEMFSKVLDNVSPFLEEGRYLGIVIGDKYSKGEWIPLGFYVMNEVLKKKEFMLKSIIVKNFEDTRAKRNQKELWRYRALAGGFYVFKHEYILLFCKKEKKIGLNLAPMQLEYYINWAREDIVGHIIGSRNFNIKPILLCLTSHFNSVPYDVIKQIQALGSISNTPEIWENYNPLKF